LVALAAAVITAGPVALAAADDPGADGGSAISPSTPDWSLAPADGDLGSARTEFAYSLAAGAETADGVVVESTAEEPLRLKIHAADAHTTSKGLFDLSPATEERKDAGGWIAFGSPDVDADPESSTAGSVLIVIEPGASVTVPFMVRIPKDAAPGDHAAGIVASAIDEAGKPEDGQTAALPARVAVAGELAPSLEITDLRLIAAPSADPFRSGDLTITYTLVNTGNARLTPAETLDVSGPGGAGRRAGEPVALPEILPGSHLDREVTVPGVFPLFKITVQVRVSGVSSGDEAEGITAATDGEASVWSVPLLWIGVFLVLLAVAVTLPPALWRRRRRQRRTVADGGATPGEPHEDPVELGYWTADDTAFAPRGDEPWWPGAEPGGARFDQRDG
jgi:hypothetical protein